MEKKRRLNNIIYHIGMILGSFVMIYPLVWLFASSLKTNAEYYGSPYSLLPQSWAWSNYVEGWKGFARLTFATFYKNSLFMTITCTLASVFTSALVAYGMSRMKFKGRGFWFGVMMLTMCIPGQVLQVPTYLFFHTIGWTGTFLPIIVPAFTAGASTVFMMMQFMRGIPKDMDEAATIDGCGPIQIFTRITLPLIKPALGISLITGFIGNWQNYMGALLYLNKPELYPVSLALTLYTDETGTNYGPMFAMSALSLVPVLTLYFIFQKSLTQGITITGLKG